MDEFEFLFTFYGLLLGLALANVATGLADMWRSRDDIRLGICAPLLGLVILSFSIGQWHVAWAARIVLTVDAWTLLIAVGVTLPYVFVSQAMFPKDTAKWASLDDYYLGNAGAILGALLLSPLIAMVANSLMYGFGLGLQEGLRIVTSILIPAGLIWYRKRWAHCAGFAAMIGFNLYRMSLL